MKFCLHGDIGVPNDFKIDSTRQRRGDDVDLIKLIRVCHYSCNEAIVSKFFCDTLIKTGRSVMITQRLFLRHFENIRHENIRSRNRCRV